MILSDDPITNTMHSLHEEHDGLYIADSQDITEMVEAGKAQFNQVDERARWRGDGGQNLFGQIPNVVYWDLQRRGIADDELAFKKWLNDSNSPFVRLRPGRV